MIQRSLLLLRFLLGTAFVALSTQLAFAQNRAATPAPHALRGVRLSAEDDAPLHTILLRDGRIEAIQSAEAAIPSGLVEIDAEGLLALPAFLDAWTQAGCETPSPVIEQDRPASVGANVLADMRQANRKGIQPAFEAALVFALDEEGVKKYRKAGFGVILSSPSGEILAGHSALAVLRDAARRDVVLRGGVLQHAAFRASGSGYPNTLMALHAQLRQFFYDTQYHFELGARREAGKSGPRPAWDRDLLVGAQILDGEEVLLCEAQSARDIRRWMRLSQEFGFKIAIAGGAEAWRVASELAARQIPVVLDLDWGKEVEDPDAVEEEEEEAEEEVADVDPEEDAGQAAEESPEQEDTDEAETGLDYSYHEPEGVQREKRRLWIERRDNAVRLQEAGVRVLFGSGSRNASELMEALRTLVEAGYSKDLVQASLTSAAAEWLGVGAEFGQLKVGHSATLCLWSDDPTEEDAQVLWSFVEGFPEEFEIKKEDGEGPAEGVDLSGTWSLSMSGEEGGGGTMTVTMDEEGAIKGTATLAESHGEESRQARVRGTVSGHDVALTFTLDMGEGQTEITVECKLKGDTLKGKGRLSVAGHEMDLDVKAKRVPDAGQGGAL
jgi:imidazolonepropionase-like amidohydrolase